MSDPEDAYGSGRGPYGQQNPDGRQQDPYAQQSPYGQNPYGQPAYDQAFGYAQGDRLSRPGTVTAAAITTMALSAITAVLLVVGVIAVVAARDQIMTDLDRELASDPALEGVSASGAAGAVLAILSLISAVWLIASVAVIVLLFTGGANEWYAQESRRS